MTKDEALKMAIDWFEGLIEANAPIYDEERLILNACKEALEQSAQEPVVWMKSAIDNARDVCKYLDHDMIDEAKAHTKFFWNDLDKIKEFEDALSNSDTI